MKRSKFALSHTKLASCDMGELIPLGCFEVLPGDSIQQATSCLVRASPLLAPVMHPVQVRLHHWFVPYRLIWEDFEDFITGGPDGMDASVYPTRSSASVTVGSLHDYLGIPPGTYGVARPYSILPFRAYDLIWNENYRDPDLDTPATISLASGVDATTSSGLRQISWEKDYFTSARPWEQKGPAITIPLGTSAPVVGLGALTGATTATGLTGTGVIAAGDLTSGEQAFVSGPTGNDNLYFKGQTAGSIGPSNRPQVFADLTAASAITITLLREALALQRFEEARARFGSRYVEYLRYLGVQSSDARLQRPEYLGGGQQTISFSEVLQTAEGTDPVGELRGHGITGLRTNRYRRYIEEHGIVMSLFSVRPKTIYMQGLSRMWNRRTKEDFWQRELEHIGQQEVLNKEIYLNHTAPDGVFGYQNRYDEYRGIPSTVAGEFRTSTLNHWHMAREFSSDPALNSTFTQCVPTERTFAVPSEDVIYVQARHNIQARRLVSRSASSFIY